MEFIMEFFEFFFSGPGWGWKAIALILFINVIFEGITNIIHAIFEGKIKQIRAKMKTNIDNEDSTKDTEATVDDFR